ncbi:polya polymerase [Lachnospiraceae bacterium]|nr:polya polymerase [Lachnospiraceae bacterium]
MKLYNINSPEEFFKVVDQCKGTVELVSTQGDRLNLKSQLTKYITITSLFSDESIISELELVAYDPEDATLLMEYMFSKDKHPESNAQ